MNLGHSILLLWDCVVSSLISLVLLMFALIFGGI